MIRLLAGLALLGVSTSVAPSIVAQAPAIAAQHECPVPDTLAASEFSVSCRTDPMDFLRRIETACADRKRSSPDGCAALIYTIDPTFDDAFMKKHNLPPTMTIKVGRIAVGDTLAQMAMTVVNSNGSSGKLTLPEINNLLAPIRIANRVVEYEVSGGQTRFDQAVNLYEQGVRYYPALFVSRKDAPKVMTRDAIRKHFRIPVHIVQNLERLLDEDCLLYKKFC